MEISDAIQMVEWRFIIDAEDFLYDSIKYLLFVDWAGWTQAIEQILNIDRYLNYLLYYLLIELI